jgi:D-sedoheptulose 7-phosphate isomerase
MQALLDTRLMAAERFFGACAQQLAEACRATAERFMRGGRLIALGTSPQARSDARHVAVEFVHPVIVGKRALPALAMTGSRRLVAALLEPDDVVVAFEPDPEVERARELGCLTLAFARTRAEWELVPGSGNALIDQECVETAYHMLWELVHVFLEHAGSRSADPGAAGFLYPFLAGPASGLDDVVADVCRSVAAKAAEIRELREQTLTEGRATLLAAASELRRRFDGGGRLLALGNGGSATDAADAAADFSEPSCPWPSRAALDLAEDPAVLTAIANDVGVEAIFARQIIAHGRAGDALLALSTSGESGNVIAALAEARRIGMQTIALVGYDGGTIARERLAEHVLVSRSQHIPRIQEAQASAYHVLRELVEW